MLVIEHILKFCILQTCRMGNFVAPPNKHRQAFLTGVSPRGC